MLKQSGFVKIRVTAPVDSAETVRQAMAEAGSGKQGNYSCCSFSCRGVGRFLPENGAKPAVGAIGVPEEVVEEMIEAICHVDLVEKVVVAIRRVHPYEEPAIDIVSRLDII
ncbi:MAG: hypothetical protein ABII98_00420 [bacterium]|nr:hypothetical protein [Patescibacteria group bacterium]